MNPIPVTWCAAGALAMSVAAFAGGWTVRDWKADSDTLAAKVAADKRVEKARQQAHREATEHETEQADAEHVTTIREREIRTKHVPVPGSCEPNADVVRVLDDALGDANARASGQPRAAVPEPSPAP